VIPQNEKYAISPIEMQSTELHIFLGFSDRSIPDMVNPMQVKNDWFPSNWQGLGIPHPAPLIIGKNVSDRHLRNARETGFIVR